MSQDVIFIQAIGPERSGRIRGLCLGATQSKLCNLKNNNEASSHSPTQRDEEFMKMKSKMEKMKKFLQAMGYSDDSDDDLEEILPNENSLDACSTHRQMASDNNQASPKERDPLLPQLERSLLLQFVQSNTQLKNKNINTSKANEGEGDMLLRSSHDASNSGHDESLVATFGEHEQHLATMKTTGS